MSRENPFTENLTVGEAPDGDREDSQNLSESMESVLDFFRAKSPESAEILFQFSPQDFSLLDQELKMVGDAWGLRGLPRLHEKLRGQFDLDWLRFSAHLLEWITARRSETVIDADHTYKNGLKRKAIARKISALIEAA